MDTKSGSDRLASQISRRSFLKASAASATAAAIVGLKAPAVGQTGGRIRVGVIGCGGRGSGAAIDILNAATEIDIAAVGDVFRDRAEGCMNRSKEHVANQKKENVKYSNTASVTPEKCFVGFDAYQKVINSGVDLVILAAPPGFRPSHFKAAVDAGKHVFMEKPVAVDGPGIRTVLAAAEASVQKRLGVVAGTQRRHQKPYVETMKRIRGGMIGDIVSAQCYWNQGGLWMHPRQAEWTDMEWQLKNWLYFTWLSGDHIVEQHVHNIDVINWAMNAHPVKAYGMGGRQVRTDPAYGHIFDHFTIEFEYPSGARLMSQCRQIDGCANNVSEHLIGTRGTSNAAGLILRPWKLRQTEPNVMWKYEGDAPNPYVQEHADLVASIRAGKPINEGRQVAESVLTAIMGRMSAYTGQVVTWEQALESKEDTFPAKLEFGALPVPPVAVPGKTPLL